MKKLCGKVLVLLISVFLISVTILTSVFYAISYHKELNAEKQTGNEAIAQLSETLNELDKANQKATELFVEDYLNRLNFVNYLLRDYLLTDSRVPDQEWTQILATAEVRAIYVIDSSGVIVQTNDKQSLGLNFYEHKETADFLPLIEDREEEGYHVRLDGVAVTTGERGVYLGMNGPNGYVVQIKVDEEVQQSYQGLMNLFSYVQNIPTNSNRRLFVLDATSGELLAITRNNQQTVKMANRLDTLLRRVGDPGIEKLDGTDYLLCAEAHGPYLICFASDMTSIQKRVMEYTLGRAAVIFLVLLIVSVVVFYSLNRYVLRHLLQINDSVNRFIHGDANVQFPKGYTQEVAELSKNLEKLVKVIGSGAIRLSSIVDQLGVKMEAYEYCADLNQCFFSEHALEMMGVTEEEAVDIIKNVYQNDMETEGLLRGKDGRVVRSYRVRSGGVLYGFLYDITEESQTEARLRMQLQMAQGESVRDSLTGLYNRKYLRDTVVRHINEQEEPHGVLLSIDMDNFKSVNDSEGHLEGDRVLVRFAQLLNESFRASDIKARMGGDEFAVFLPNVVDMDVLRDKINRLIENSRSRLADKYQAYRLSISVGAAILNKEHADYDTLYQLADAAMYVAKQKGKNSFYINEEGNSCMRKECIHCRAVCARRTALYEGEQ